MTETAPHSPSASASQPSAVTSSHGETRSSRVLAAVLLIVFPMLLLGPHLILFLLPAAARPVADTLAWSGALTSILLMTLYTARHYGFALHRLFREQRVPYLDIATGHWPPITVLVMAHNEGRVIEGSLRALLESDYPADRLIIMPVNDRSTDDTADIINRIARLSPQRIQPLHRTDGEGGKPAALEWACRQVKDDIIVIFDADYLPGKGLLKQLVIPFFDPEVGATMGRVVPLNARSNLLTRTLALERCAGYQINQQARQNMGLTAQYGGTVGAVRRQALESVGGWSTTCLAEDTDLTIRLRCAGWHVVYQNRAECYEEVPEEWSVRIRQLSRWTQGHHHVLLRHWPAVLRSPQMERSERLDAFMLLGVFLIAPVMLVGWSSCVYLYFRGYTTAWFPLGATMALLIYSGCGNFGTFFEIAAGSLLDRCRSSLLVLPFMMVNFLVSCVVMSRGVLKQSWNTLTDRKGSWAKTVRYRQPDNQNQVATNGERA